VKTVIPLKLKKVRLRLEQIEGDPQRAYTAAPLAQRPQHAECPASIQRERSDPQGPGRRGDYRAVRQISHFCRLQAQLPRPQGVQLQTERGPFKKLFSESEAVLRGDGLQRLKSGAESERNRVQVLYYPAELESE